jgi:hypothetical protein
LGKRFAASDLDQIAPEFIQFGKNIVNANMLAASKRVFAVAPNAPHRTARQTHE